MSVLKGYLLDTNVISELRKRQPDPHVMAFFGQVNPFALYLSVLTLGELRKGVAIKQRSDPPAALALETWVDELETRFSNRILAFDSRAARIWGEISSDRPRPVVDTQLAATAILHRLTLVTRNTGDLAGLTVSSLNPWLPSVSGKP